MEKISKEMLTQDILDKVNGDEAFCKAFVSAETAPALQKVLADHGFALSVEEVEAIYTAGVKGILAVNSGDELTEDQLEDVAGGGVLRGTLRLAVSAGVGFGYGCLCGLCPAACAGANWVAGGLTVWTTAGYVQKGW